MQFDPTVIVIDPDVAIGEALTLLLYTYGIRTRTFVSAESFLEAWNEDKAKVASLLLVEANLPGTSGLSLMRQLHEEYFNSPIIIMTNIATAEIRQWAIKFGANDVIEKPFISEFIVNRIVQLLSLEE
ncbi:MAG: FixJ family two-component response regulator [Parasphingorhabdus sp.]|jgi:FixJ family two-component response regulator